MLGVYADSVLISLVNNMSPRMVKTLVIMEDWKPATHERVTIMKLYFLRILNLSTILYRLILSTEFNFDISSLIYVATSIRLYIRGILLLENEIFHSLFQFLLLNFFVQSPIFLF